MSTEPDDFVLRVPPSGGQYRPHALMENVGERMAGVPNTLPPQDFNRSAELGRVGCSAAEGPRVGSSSLPRATRHKTSFL